MRCDWELAVQQSTRENCFGPGEVTKDGPLDAELETDWKGCGRDEGSGLASMRSEGGAEYSGHRARPRTDTHDAVAIPECKNESCESESCESESCESKNESFESNNDGCESNNERCESQIG